jgi:hypothetical protein
MLYQGGSVYIEVSIDPSHGSEVRGIPYYGIDSIYCLVLFYGVIVENIRVQDDRVAAQPIALYLLQGVKHGIMSCTS